MPLTGRQVEALKASTATINLWYGSVRSSKTHAELVDFITTMARLAQVGKFKGDNLVLGVSTNTVWRNLFQPLLTSPEFTFAAPALHYKQNAAMGTMFGVPFAVLGAGTERAAMNIQGVTALNVWGDEAEAWTESAWNMITTRLSLPNSRLLATCNPGSRNHFLHRLVVERAGTDPDIHVEKFLLEENTTLDRRVVARLKRQYTGLFYQRMIEARWVAAEGAIYDMWDRGTMIVDPLPTISRLVCVGVDYGIQHPTAGYALGMGADGRLYVVSEWAPNPGDMRLTDKQLADDFTEWWRKLTERFGMEPQFLFVDPAATSLIEELWQRRFPVKRALNPVVPGINTVSSLLGSGHLKISAECTRLVEGMERYRWDAKATLEGVDKPVKIDDDEVDALRYAVHSSRHLWRGQLAPAPTVAIRS